MRNIDMVNENKVRIGNLLFVQFGYYGGGSPLNEQVPLSLYSVSADGDFWFNRDGRIITKSKYVISGIPLTQEWLAQLGFEKQRDSNYLLFNEFRIAYDIRAGHVIEYKNVFICCMEYVHELQNLVYAITSKELDIKI